METAHLIRSSLLSGVKNLHHGFSLRSLPESQLGELDRRTATVKQIHKAEIAWTDELRKGAWRDADALGTKKIGLPVGVFTADCSPILLVSVNRSGSAHAVMAVHAGWRGAAAKIADKAVEALWREAPGAQLLAAVGPTIGFDAFEVGEEVIAAFPCSEANGLARFLRLEGEKKKYLFHLAGENVCQIESAAARLKIPLRMEVLRECTFQNSERYPSFRRDRENAGRMLSFVELTA